MKRTFQLKCTYSCGKKFNYTYTKDQIESMKRFSIDLTCPKCGHRGVHRSTAMFKVFYGMIHRGGARGHAYYAVACLTKAEALKITNVGPSYFRDYWREVTDWKETQMNKNRKFVNPCIPALQNIGELVLIQEGD